mgnify:CR=1 FL=1
MYYTTKEFAEYVHIAPVTINKRVSSGAMPKADKTQQAKRGRPGFLWREQTASDYKLKLCLKLYRLTSVKYSLRVAADMCKIEESQARKLLHDLETMNQTRVDGYSLFMQTSAKLGVKLL